MKNAKNLWRLLGYFLIPAIFLAFGGGSLRAQDTYTKITQLSDLTNGDEVIIVSNGQSFDGEITSNWGKYVAASVSNNSVNTSVATTASDYTKPHAFIVENLNVAAGTFALAGKLSEGYLGGEAKKLEWSSSSVTMKLNATKGLENATTTTSVYLLYNSGSGFRYYGSTTALSSTLTASELYKKQAASSEPFVRTDETEVSYNIQPTENLNKTLSFTAGNLTSALAVSVASATEGKNSVISVDKSTVEQSATAFDLTLTTSNLAEGTYSDIITIKMGETTMATVTVNLSVKDADIYQLVTDATTLKADDVVLIVGVGTKADDDTYYAMTATESSSKRTAVKITVENSIITSPDIADNDNKGRACEFTLLKNLDDQYAFHDLVNNNYLQGTTDNTNTTSGNDAFYFSVSIVNGKTSVKNPAEKGRYIRHWKSGSNNDFRSYTSESGSGAGYDIHLYKKYVPTCEKVTNVQHTEGVNSVTLTWGASTSEPSGYKVIIKQGETEVVSADVTGNTYTKNDLTENTTYTYSIVSVCSETLSSGAVTGTFTTHKADVKALSVSLSGATANGNYTGAITFTFNTTNCTLGSDVKVSYMITGDKSDYAKEDDTDQTTLVLNDFVSDSYEALFELVDMEGNSFADKIEVEKTFTVDLPDVAAPKFSPEPNSTFFTSAQTITLACDTPNATIWYSIDDAAFVQYTAPIELNQTDTVEIKAYATKAGMDNSATITKTYRIRLPETVPNLKAVYGKVANDVVKVSGQMVVTHKDTGNACRVWAQDIDKENGASMLLYGVPAAEYKELKVGDVLQNVAGTVDIFSDLYELNPTEKVEAVEHNHSVYVDTLTADYINKNIATVQNALVCVENVTFTSGTFATTNTAARKLTLNQGDVQLQFYTGYNKADYVGETTPAGRLNVTGILGVNNGTAQITARNKADMVQAPCTVPENITVEAHETEADLDWDGLADNYSVRYAKEEASVESATPVAVSTSHLHMASLDANTTYYYQIKSVCGADGYESEWSAVKSFTTMAAGTPSIRMTSPVNEPKFTDSVLVTFTVKNVTLKTADTSARIVFSDGFTFVTTDTAYKRALPTGNYSVRVELIKNNDTLTPNIRTQSRTFKVDLPNVADPVFTPAAGRYANSVEVTLDCATQGAAIFYAQGEGEYTTYTAGSKIELTESAVLKAFACKDRMDTSATITAAYTIYTKLAPEGDLILNENFDGCGSSWTGNKPITNLDDYTTMPGWTGDKVYDGLNNVKLGTGSAKGILTTPSLNLSYDNGKYYVAFTVATWANNSEKTSIYLKAGDSTILVENIAKQPEMTEYVYLLDNGTADTKITFEAVEASNNRYFLDSIRVYQVLPNETMLIVTSACTMNTVQGTPVSSEITVKGKLLSENVAVSCPEGNFSVAPATLDKDEVMSEEGAKFTVTFNGSVASDNVNITLTSGELSETIAVTATATPVVEVENIAALRAGEQNTLYRVKGEVVITAMDSYRNYKWIQDATGAILIDDQPGYVTTTYKVGDGITGVYGKLGNYGGQLQLIMTGNLPEASSHDNTLEPEVVTVDELTENIEKYCSRLVRINGLSLEEAEGNWEGNADNMAVDADGNSINIRTFVRNGNYVGEEKPQGRFNLIAIAGIYNDAAQVSPRTKEDIIPVEVNPCDAPTNLKAVVADKSVTLTWNGAAEQYRVVVTLGDKEVCNELVSEKTYALNNLEVGTYAWKVASVCEDGEQWANGAAFEVKSVANEDAELQADVYPNPTDGVVYIRLAESARMEIFTLGGVVIRSEMLNAGRNELRLDQSGIYFIRLSNGSAVTVKRIVVR